MVACFAPVRSSQARSSRRWRRSCSSSSRWDGAAPVTASRGRLAPRSSPLAAELLRTSERRPAGWLHAGRGHRGARAAVPAKVTLTLALAMIASARTAAVAWNRLATAREGAAGSAAASLRTRSTRACDPRAPPPNDGCASAQTGAPSAACAKRLRPRARPSASPVAATARSSQAISALRRSRATTR